MRQDINKTQIELAEEHYEESTEDFHETLSWHHYNGWVINVPYGFGMGYFYEENGEKIVYVSYINGEIGRLLRFGLNYKLDKIEFKRNFKGRVRKYDFNKFVQRVK